jgi:deoxyadenosine/deoxycytidine kinase
MYIVEGNIGTGKSTFLKLVAQHLPHISVILEPRHHWQSDDGESLLGNFYQDPHRWAYTMETLAMICRVREHVAEQQHLAPNRIMERSIYSGHYCFAQNDFDNGFMTPVEWFAYNQWFNFLVPNKCKPPLGFIYLKTDPEVSYERIKKRNRGSETGISLDYLKQIDACHNKFLIEKDGILPSLKNVPVLTLACNTEFETDQQTLSKHLQLLTSFLQETQLAKALSSQVITSF